MIEKNGKMEKTNSTRMIQKILHQVWVGKKKIPAKFIKWRDGWRKLHPDWEYKIWTDDDVLEIKHLLDKCDSLASKSNVIRLWVVLKYGGVYCDMDFQWNKNMDELLKCNAFACKQDDELFCNAIFGAEKGNRWVKYQFNVLPKFVNRPAPWGPHLMTLASKIKDFTELPTNYFYPYSWDMDFQDASNFPSSYAVHHWEMSWKKLHKRIKYIFKKILVKLFGVNAFFS